MNEQTPKRKPRTQASITPAILDGLNARIKQVIDANEGMRKEIEAIKIVQATQQEHIRSMSSDFEQLQKRLEAMEATILDNQRKATNRIIGVQAAVLLLVLSTVIGLLAKVLFP